VDVFATPDSTLDTLITSYINTCSIILLTYDVANIGHLRYIEKKYIPILKSHRDCQKLTVFLVGSRMTTTPAPSMLEEVSKTITLMLVVHAIRNQVGARVGTLDVTVDEFSSVEQFKERVLSFVILE
jgi:GTPase SAR1 family protein